MSDFDFSVSLASPIAQRTRSHKKDEEPSGLSASQQPVESDSARLSSAVSTSQAATPFLSPDGLMEANPYQLRLKATPFRGLPSEDLAAWIFQLESTAEMAGWKDDEIHSVAMQLLLSQARTVAAETTTYAQLREALVKRYLPFFRLDTLREKLSQQRFQNGDTVRLFHERFQRHLRRVHLCKTEGKSGPEAQKLHLPDSEITYIFRSCLPPRYCAEVLFFQGSQDNLLDELERYEVKLAFQRQHGITNAIHIDEPSWQPSYTNATRDISTSWQHDPADVHDSTPARQPPNKQSESDTPVERCVLHPNSKHSSNECNALRAMIKKYGKQGQRTDNQDADNN